MAEVVLVIVVAVRPTRQPARAVQVSGSLPVLVLWLAPLPLHVGALVPAPAPAPAQGRGSGSGSGSERGMRRVTAVRVETLRAGARARASGGVEPKNSPERPRAPTAATGTGCLRMPAPSTGRGPPADELDSAPRPMSAARQIAAPAAGAISGPLAKGASAQSTNRTRWPAHARRSSATGTAASGRGWVGVRATALPRRAVLAAAPAGAGARALACLVMNS